MFVLSREHVPMESFSFTYSMHFKFICPIANSVISKLPVDNNESIALKSLECALDSSNLKSAVDYEFNKVKRVNEAVFKACMDSGAGGLSEYAIFNELGVDLDNNKGFAHEARSITCSLKNIILKSGLKAVKGRVTERFNEYYGITLDSINGAAIERGRLVPFDVPPLYCFNPPFDDYRNFLAPFKAEFKLFNIFNFSDEVFSNKFSQEYFYGCNRNFDSGISALIAREWVINYLNALQS